MPFFIALIMFFQAGTLLGSSRGSVKCNKKQTICEITNRRLTIGDWVGFFSKSGYLSALGKVRSIKGQVREIRIKKVFHRISRSHTAEIVKDKHVKKPRKYFRIRDKVSESFWGAHFNIVSMGVGTGLSGLAVSGSYSWKWQYSTYFIARSWFLNGSGEASSAVVGNPAVSVSVSSLGTVAGITEMIQIGENIVVHPYIAGGGGYTSVEVGSTEDASATLNGRLEDGILLAIEAGINAYYRWGEYYPTVGINVLSLHNSINVGILGGITTEI